MGPVTINYSADTARGVAERRVPVSSVSFDSRLTVVERDDAVVPMYLNVVCARPCLNKTLGYYCAVASRAEFVFEPTMFENALFAWAREILLFEELRVTDRSCATATV